MLYEKNGYESVLDRCKDRIDFYKVFFQKYLTQIHQASNLTCNIEEEIQGIEAQVKWHHREQTNPECGMF